MVYDKLRNVKMLPVYINQGLTLMNSLVLLQILIGMSLHIFGISPLLQVFHLWLASIIIGTILILYAGLMYRGFEK